LCLAKTSWRDAGKVAAAAVATAIAATIFVTFATLLLLLLLLLLLASAVAAATSAIAAAVVVAAAACASPIADGVVCDVALAVVTASVAPNNHQVKPTDDALLPLPLSLLCYIQGSTPHLINTLCRAMVQHVR